MYNRVPDLVANTCFELHRMILLSSVKSITHRNKLRSRELTRLTRRGIVTIIQAFDRDDDSTELIKSIIIPSLHKYIDIIQTMQTYTHVQNNEPDMCIYDELRHNCVKISSLTSRQIRNTLSRTEALHHTKLLHTNADDAIRLYNRIHKIKSIQNRTKLLRLIHGDVYCGSRLKKFGLSDNDRCIRCFGEETILHLLIECPFTKEIWGRLGISPHTLEDIVINLNVPDLEIMSNFLSEIIFRKKVLPPDILIRTIFSTYAAGTSASAAVTKMATNKLTLYHHTGQWS